MDIKRTSVGVAEGQNVQDGRVFPMCLAPHDVNDKIKQLWKRVEVPPNREDISRALDEAGLTSCKSMKRGIRKQVRKGGGGGSSRAGGKVCNSHMQDIDDGLDYKTH